MGASSILPGPLVLEPLQRVDLEEEGADFLVRRGDVQSLYLYVNHGNGMGGERERERERD